MGSETQTTRDFGPAHVPWQGGVLAGLAGGAVFGVMITTMVTGVMDVAIPSLYGMRGMAAGWVAHLFHSAVLGVVFAVLASAAGVDASYGTSVALGLGYGAVLWLVLAAFVVPVWLGGVGSPASPSVPNVVPRSLVGHLVYGGVAGAVLPAVRRL